MTSPSERIGFIGLGVMGLPMARNLMKAGFRLTVADIVPDRAALLGAAGAAVAGTASEVATRSDIVISMVPNSPDVEAVYFGPHGIADSVRAGMLAIDMSTIAPAVARRVAQRSARIGLATLDAPVTGGELGAIQGTLTVMIGGERSDVDRATPLFTAMAKAAVHIGPHGAGQTCKLANQIAVAVNNLAASEALVFAASQRIDLEKVREVLASGSGSSWAMKTFAPKMLARDFRPGFTIDLQQKDLRLVLDTAFDAHVSLPGTALTHQLYSALQQDGGGREAHIALIKAIERLSGIEARGN